MGLIGTTRPCRAPYHTVSEVGLIGGGQVLMPGRCRGRTMGCACWMHGRRAVATSWRCDASPSRTGSLQNHLARIFNLAVLDGLAARTYIAAATLVTPS
jgi:Magnesium chelatase, subunit ChlI